MNALPTQRKAEFVERRQFPRQSAAWNVALVPGGAPEARRLAAECIDLSGAGAAVLLDKALLSGERATLFLAPPAETGREPRMLRFAAAVVYAVPAGQRFRVGLRLVENQSLDKLRPTLRAAPAVPSVGAPPASAAVPTPLRATPGAGVAEGARAAAPGPVAGGLLDHIKAAADERLADIEMSVQFKECLLHDWQHRVDAALRPINQYFLELARSFDILKPKLANGFSIPCVTTLRELTWVESRADSRARKTASEIQQLESISLGYRWRGLPPKLRIVLRQDDAKLGEQSLERCGMSCFAEKVESSSGIAEVALSFPNDLQCAVSISADDDARCFRLRLVNVETPGAVDYSLPAERLDNVLLEEIVRAVIGERSALASLLGKGRR